MRRCLSDSRSFASTANARVAWPTHRLKWPMSRHAAAHDRWTAARAASVVARSRASRKYFRAALGALRMQASPLAALARAAAARLPPCSSRTKRSRSCSARKPRASCEAIDAVPRAGWRLWGSPVRFLRETRCARALWVRTRGTTRRSTGCARRRGQPVKGLARIPQSSHGFFALSRSCCSLGATPGVLENFLRPYSTD